MPSLLLFCVCRLSFTTKKHRSMGIHLTIKCPAALQEQATFGWCLAGAWLCRLLNRPPPTRAFSTPGPHSVLFLFLLSGGRQIFCCWWSSFSLSIVIPHSFFRLLSSVFLFWLMVKARMTSCGLTTSCLGPRAVAKCRQIIREKRKS